MKFFGVDNAIFAGESVFGGILTGTMGAILDSGSAQNGYNKLPQMMNNLVTAASPDK